MPPSPPTADAGDGGPPAPPANGDTPVSNGDSAGLPAPDAHGAGRPRERTTRKPMAFWDRIKLLLLLAVVFWFFVWSAMADNPILPFRTALDDTLLAKWWLLLLFGAEALRQSHFLLAESSPAYHRFWSQSVFGRLERRAARMDDWNRYRLARVLKVLGALALLSVVLGALFGVSPVTALFELPARLFAALPFIFQLAFGFLFVMSQFVGLFWFLSRGGIDVYYPDDIDTRFDDVWGQDHVLKRVQENMVFLDAPEEIEARGGYVPGGVLLWGPPGTGKTLLAEAVAGETGKPFVFVDPGAFIQMFFGIGILKVKRLFRKLRRLALQYGGVIVFFDEADSLGNRGTLAAGPPGSVPGSGQAGWAPGAGQAGSALDGEHLRWLSEAAQHAVLQQTVGSTRPGEDRPHRDGIMMGGMGGGGGMGTLQALLTELSGLKKPRGFLNRHVRRVLGMRPKPPPKYRIMVMMATNMPSALDEALLRPGRIDRIYKVGYPTKEGRVRTYQGYLDKVSHDLSPEQVEKLAVITPYATGATIKDLVNEALITAIRQGRERIRWTDVLHAKQLKELGPPEDVEYIERERHAVAVHEACHAVVAHRTRRHLAIDLATIEKGGNYLGMVSSIKPEDQFTRWRSEYEADIKVSLASLAGERLFFDGDSSSGVSGDLDGATTLATMMEGFWGMGSTVASHGVTHSIGVGGGGRPTGDDDHERELLKGNLGNRIEENLARLLDDAALVLDRHRHEVLALAHALETHKTLSGEDVIAVLDGTEGPVVDGRPYHADGARAELEAYHEVARRAHRDHSTVAAELPVFNPEPALV